MDNRKNLLSLRIWTVLVIQGVCHVSGQTQEAREFAKICHPVERTLDLLFVLDGSGSVGSNTFSTQIEVINQIVDRIDIGENKTKIAVLQYSSYTKQEFDFSAFTTRDEIKHALSEIRYISGTTKTGKALLHALSTFSDDKGARMKRDDVAKVIVLVSDGHSQDDPRAPAHAVRSAGIELLTLGIGEYVNLDGLLEISEDPAKTFTNQTVSKFVDAFHRIAMGEKCNFAKGDRGAEIHCHDDGVTVDVLTAGPFKGHVFVHGYFHDPRCVAGANGGSTILLNLKLGTCGLQPKFMAKLNGSLVEGVVMVKFHSTLSTKSDRAFNVRCFYSHSTGGATTATPVSIGQKNDSISLDDALNRDGFVAIQSQTKFLPCAYTVHTDSSDTCALAKQAKVGDVIFHRWQCDKESIGSNIAMLVHSCVISDRKGGDIRLTDVYGCPVDTAIFGSPEYPDALTAQLTAHVVKPAETSSIQFRCSLKFCRISGEGCRNIVPPKCNTTAVRSKRESPPDEPTEHDSSIEINKSIDEAIDLDQEPLIRTVDEEEQAVIQLNGDAQPVPISLTDRARDILLLGSAAPSELIVSEVGRVPENGTSASKNGAGGAGIGWARPSETRNPETLPVFTMPHRRMTLKTRSPWSKTTQSDSSFSTASPSTTEEFPLTIQESTESTRSDQPDQTDQPESILDHSDQSIIPSSALTSSTESPQAFETTPIPTSASAWSSVDPETSGSSFQFTTGFQSSDNPNSTPNTLLLTSLIPSDTSSTGSSTTDEKVANATGVHVSPTAPASAPTVPILTPSETTLGSFGTASPGTIGGPWFNNVSRVQPTSWQGLPASASSPQSSSPTITSLWKLAIANKLAAASKESSRMQSLNSSSGAIKKQNAETVPDSQKTSSSNASLPTLDSNLPVIKEVGAETKHLSTATLIASSTTTTTPTSSTTMKLPEFESDEISSQVLLIQDITDEHSLAPLPEAAVCPAVATTQSSFQTFRKFALRRIRKLH